MEYSKEIFGIGEKELNHLASWLGENIEYDLIYRGTRDGFDSNVFHKICDDQGPTLCLIKSDKGFVFGGYTSVSWQSNNNIAKDEKAFIFSLTKGTIHPL